MSNSTRALAASDMPTKEQDHHREVQESRLVSGDEIQRALVFLRDSAKDLGEARARVIRSVRMLQHTEALLFLASEQKSAEARKADARTDKRWLDAAHEEAIAAGEYEKLKSLREAAAMRIECWRTESSNLRALK